MARKNRNAKVYKTCSKTMFKRKGKQILDIKTKEVKGYKSINAAKRETRKLVDKHGLGSVVVV